MIRKADDTPPPPPMQPLFALGTVKVTASALAVMHAHPAGLGLGLILLDLHRFGIWEETSGNSQRANLEAIKIGARVITAWEPLSGNWLFIVTEGDRSETHIIAPEEF